MFLDRGDCKDRAKLDTLLCSLLLTKIEGPLILISFLSIPVKISLHLSRRRIDSIFLSSGGKSGFIVIEAWRD